MKLLLIKIISLTFFSLRLLPLACCIQDPECTDPKNAIIEELVRDLNQARINRDLVKAAIKFHQAKPHHQSRINNTVFAFSIAGSLAGVLVGIKSPAPFTTMPLGATAGFFVGGYLGWILATYENNIPLREFSQLKKDAESLQIHCCISNFNNIPEQQEYQNLCIEYQKLRRKLNAHIKENHPY